MVKTHIMHIGSVAEETGLSVPTIRYYEQQNFLDDRHVQRQSNNYRLYNTEAIIRLKHIAHARSVGFTIKELRTLLLDYDRGTLTLEKRTKFLIQKISSLNEMIAKLQEQHADFKKELAAINKQR